MVIKLLEKIHWSEVKAIYEMGIATGNATFQTEAPSWENWDKSHDPNVRLVAVEHDSVLGWASISRVSARPVYAGVAEVSVYVDSKSQNQGIGSQLLAALIDLSEQHGYWTLQAGIFPENIRSIKIHEKLGFKIVGRRERIGKMKDTWRDTVLLERRSTCVGIE